MELLERMKDADVDGECCLVSSTASALSAQGHTCALPCLQAVSHRPHPTDSAFNIYMRTSLPAVYIDYLKQGMGDPPRPMLPPVPRSHPDYVKWFDWKRIMYLRHAQHVQIARYVTIMFDQRGACSLLHAEHQIDSHGSGLHSCTLLTGGATMCVAHVDAWGPQSADHGGEAADKG